MYFVETFYFNCDFELFFQFLCQGVFITDKETGDRMETFKGNHVIKYLSDPLVNGTYVHSNNHNLKTKNN